MVAPNDTVKPLNCYNPVFFDTFTQKEALMSNNDEQNTLESLQFKLDSALRRQDEAMQDAAIWKDAYRIEKDAHSVTLRALEVVRGEVKDAHRRLQDWQTGAKGY